MDVLYTCDNNYVWLMGISMLSLFETNTNVDEISVYLIGENISLENFEKLNQLAKKYNREFFLIEQPKLNYPEKLESSRWPKSAFVRLYSSLILPKTTNKILYLDCDTIIKKSLFNVFDDTNDFPVYGVLDCISNGYKKNIGIKKDDPYINAGVLVLNLDMIRQLDINLMIENFVNKYSNFINYADQDILNGMFNGKIGILNPKYDFMTIENYKYNQIKKLRRFKMYYSKDELYSAKNDICIIHYTTNLLVVRPWYENSNHPQKKDFMDVFTRSPWNYISLNIYKFKGKKNRFLKFVLAFPSFLSFPFLGLIHGIMLPFFKRIRG